MSKQADDYVYINHGWRITWNPEGGGLMLCVDRGISCENHTQVVSSHTTNTPDVVTVRAIVGEIKSTLDKEIHAFVGFMQALNGEWEIQESVSLLFCHHLVKMISQAAEKREFG